VAPLTVLTWNLQRRSPDRAGMRGVLERVQPDLIFLQEADGGELSAEPSLAAWVDHSYIDMAAGSGPGMAILSRLPLLRAWSFQGTPGVWDRPRVLVASVAQPGGDLLAVCVHAKAPMPIPFLHAGERNTQLADLAAWLAPQVAAGERIVVAGDCNAVRLDLDGLIDVAAALQRPEPTWRPFGVPWLPPLLRLDRVFVSPLIVPLALQVDCVASRSDHCPVVATLQLDDGVT
jgi:endonuclease/exonuclease/phosphatase family metal-dependent hydrolase